MLLFDIETNGFLDVLDTIHCLHILDRTTGKRMRFSGGRYADGSPARRDGSIEDGLRLLQEAEVICGHNIISFDIPAIQKLYPWFKPKGRVYDTLVVARLVWTDLKDIDAKAIKARIRPPEFTGKMVGSHSLEAWGFRLGVFKGDYSAMKRIEAIAMGLEGDDEIGRYTWASFSREMDDYCEQDNEGTLALLEKIESKSYSEEAIQLELDVGQIIALQETHGFLFDSDAALRLTAELSGIRAQLEDELRETFKPWYAPCVYKGEHEVLIPKTNNKALGRTKDCPLTKVEVICFNPGSRHHIADRMKTLFGWSPVEFTENGQPKVDETTLGSLDYPEAKKIVRYLTVQKRLGQLAEGDNAWLRRVQADGRIHGRVNTNGAVTGRMTHFAPNMAQVPAAGALWGKDCRALFTVQPGYRLVGCDAEGLELRVLGHFLHRYDGGAYADAVVNGKKEDETDVHNVNKRAAGLNLRDSAKTLIYAMIYGAGPHKIGSIVYDDYGAEAQAAFDLKYPQGNKRDEALARLGKKTTNRLMENLPALGSLMALVKEKAKRGYLKGLDGRLLHVRSAHSALNTLLQSGGALAMKKALVILKQDLDALGWTHGKEYGFVVNVHDEWQAEAREDLAETFGTISAAAITKAGEHFNLKCPLAGAWASGNNWAETH